MTNPEKGTQCSAGVWRQDGIWGTHYQCSRTAKVVEDGKPYCTQHAPSTVAKKRAARKEKWDSEGRRQRHRWACDAEGRAARAAIAALAEDQAESVGLGDLWRRIAKTDSEAA